MVRCFVVSTIYYFVTILLCGSTPDKLVSYCFPCCLWKPLFFGVQTVYNAVSLSACSNPHFLAFVTHLLYSMTNRMDQSLIMQELEALFAWNPCLASLASKAMGGSLSTSTRDPLWYDLHLAPDRICRRLVHVKDLHKKVAAVVDEKLQEIRESKIEFQTTAVPNFYDQA